jgi:hypothetical protein
MSARCLSGLCLVFLLLISPVAAQQRMGNNRNQPRGNQPQPQEVNVEGTIVAVAPGRGVQMTTNTNQTMTVFIPAGAQVRLLGTATPDYLKPGMCVEFVADVAKGGAVKEKVTSMTIFSPSQDRALGLYPEGAAGVKKDSKDAKAGVGPVGGDPGITGPVGGKAGRKTRGKQAAGGGGNDLLSGFDAPATKPGKSQAGTMQLPAVCTVRGQIKNLHNGSMTLLAGKGVNIKADVEDAAQIDVDSSDYAHAVRGDKVSVKGRGFPSKGMVQAESVKIDCAAQLSGNKKRPAKAGGASLKSEKPAAKPSARAKKDDPVDELAPAKEKPADDPLAEPKGK